MTISRWGTGTFHNWLLGQINVAVAENRHVTFGKRKHNVDASHFGYSAERLDEWITDPPKDLPDGKKMMAIVGSKGFKCMDDTAQKILIQVWVERELIAQDASPSFEIGGFVESLVEMSGVDFLMECLSHSKAE